ncbi:4'-phosphopantetheinyl transferase family protein [Allosediminivita pacifica]|nr:4'-phosphopantetheinyl transferase superfamily protein [Allosediminivita pacifica]
MPEGKPFLHPEAAPAFNLSHSDGLGLLALTRDTPVGVDIERVRTSADLMSIAEGSFAPAEAAALAALPVSQRTETFFACWTRKEAIVKADGRGLAVDLGAFSVSLDPVDAPRATFGPDVFEAGFRPDIRDLPVPAGYRAALATMPAIRRMRLFTLPESSADW